MSYTVQRSGRENERRLRERQKHDRELVKVYKLKRRLLKGERKFILIGKGSVLQISSKM